MRQKSPIKSLSIYMVAQTYGDLGKDKGEIRLCFENCAKKEAMSQCLLSPENDTCHVGQRLYMYLVVELERQIDTWEFGGKGVGVCVGGKDCE